MKLSATVGVVLILSGVVASGQGDTAVYELVPGSRGISRPVIVKQVRPTYTRDARAARVQGMVLLDVVIRPNGRADDVKIRESELRRNLGAGAERQGPPTVLTAAEIATLGLDRAAINAVRQWTWKPATRAGKPVAVHVVVSLNFALGPDEPPRRANGEAEILYAGPS